MRLPGVAKLPTQAELGVTSLRHGMTRVMWLVVGGLWWFADLLARASGARCRALLWGVGGGLALAFLVAVWIWERTRGPVPGRAGGQLVGVSACLLALGAATSVCSLMDLVTDPVLRPLWSAVEGAATGSFFLVNFGEKGRWSWRVAGGVCLLAAVASMLAVPWAGVPAALR